MHESRDVSCAVRETYVADKGAYISIGDKQADIVVNKLYDLKELTEQL
jgi:hypothetical protein